MNDTTTTLAALTGPPGPRARGLRLGAVVWTSVAASAVLAAACSFWCGWAYYDLPRAGRPWAPLHALLSPSGAWGHGLGIAGSAMMLSNLLYLLRRRWVRVAGWGPLNTWLAFHVAAGLGGVALVFTHGALLFDNLLARVAIGAAAVVLLTGAIGRWIYASLPRLADGREMEEGEVVLQMRATLASIEPGLREAASACERALSRALPPPLEGALAAAISLPMGPLHSVRMQALRRRLRRQLLSDGQLSAGEARDALRIAWASVALRRRGRRLAAFRSLVRSWRGVHRLATFVLILSLVAHVITVVYFGARWGR